MFKEIILEQNDPFNYHSSSGSSGSSNGSKSPPISFAELLQKYDAKPLKRGQYVQGEIVEINDKFILASVGAKRTAVIPQQDLVKIEENELVNLSPGAEVILYVLKTPYGDEDLIVSLAKGFEHRDWERAAAYLASEELLQLKVTGYNKGGLLVAFGRLPGFVPNSHIPRYQLNQNSHSSGARKAQFVGQEIQLKVIEVNRGQQRLVLSAKSAEEEMRQQRLLELKFQEGEALTGIVTNLVKFGAFVDLDGVEGLIHISQIDWQVVKRPADYLAPGDEVEVMIQSVDVERERIGLSRRALLPSPWDDFAENHQAGDLIEGTVTNLTDFGAFLRVTEGVEGLVHVSQMRGKQDFKPVDILSRGETVLVRILDILPDQQRLALSQRQVRQDEEMDWIWRRQENESMVDTEKYEKTGTYLQD